MYRAVPPPLDEFGHAAVVEDMSTANLDSRGRAKVVGEADLAVVVRVRVLVLGAAQAREALRQGPGGSV